MMRYLWIYQNHKVWILLTEKTGFVNSTSGNTILGFHVFDNK